MKRRGFAWLLPILTVFAVLFAVFFPAVYLEHQEIQESNTLHKEMVNDVQSGTDYSVSTTERLNLFRRSGITARAGSIQYDPPTDSVSVEMTTLLRGNEELPEDPEQELFKTNRDPSLRGKSKLMTRLNDYLLDALRLLEEYDVMDAENGFRARYLASPHEIRVDFCSVTDEQDPFLSMTLLCVHCVSQDADSYGLSGNTEFSLILDEETGMVYALSAKGDPQYILVEEPSRFMFMANLIGLSCTEYEKSGEGDTGYPSARFNFSGYSYWLEQQFSTGKQAVLEFNPEQKG